ncbi:hypothetical protein Aduo_018963 [Ancylostoma duodenale]
MELQSGIAISGGLVRVTQFMRRSIGLSKLLNPSAQPFPLKGGGQVQMIFTWFFVFVLSIASASFCGKSGVPFSVEVLPSGAPVLGCAQPSCVAQPADNVDDSVFNTDSSGQIDGFFREGDNSRQGYLQTNKLRANCSEEFDQLACTRKNQWVGGIEYIDHPRQPLLLQCCTFEGLRFSQIVGVSPIGPGEAVTGGEVVRDGRQISFDVIANIRKVVSSDDPKIISYEVAVRRMNCLPDPPEIEIAVDDNVEMELVQVLEKANNGSAALGHDGHAHMEKEKMSQLERKSKKKTRREKRKNGQIQQHFDRPESFGAPIFNPTAEVKQRQHYPSRFVAERKQKPVLLQLETTPQTTATPLFTLPTLPPYTFPTVPPPSQLLLLNDLNPASPPKPLTPSMSPQDLLVSPANLSALPSTSTYEQFPGFGRPQSSFVQAPELLRPQLQPLPQFGISAIGAQKRNRTQQDFSHQLQASHLGMDPQGSIHQPFGLPFYNPFGLTQRQEKPNEFTSLLDQQLFNPFTYPVGLQTPSAELSQQDRAKLPGMEEKPSIVEPSLPPMQQQLGTLFRPPPFPALSSALQNFQAQG